MKSFFGGLIRPVTNSANFFKKTVEKAAGYIPGAGTVSKLGAKGSNFASTINNSKSLAKIVKDRLKEFGEKSNEAKIKFLTEIGDEYIKSTKQNSEVDNKTKVTNTLLAKISYQQAVDLIKKNNLIDGFQAISKLEEVNESLDGISKPVSTKVFDQACLTDMLLTTIAYSWQQGYGNSTAAKKSIVNQALNECAKNLEEAGMQGEVIEKIFEEINLDPENMYFSGDYGAKSGRYACVAYIDKQNQKVIFANAGTRPITKDTLGNHEKDLASNIEELKSSIAKIEAEQKKIDSSTGQWMCLENEKDDLQEKLLNVQFKEMELIEAKYNFDEYIAKRSILKQPEALKVALKDLVADGLLTLQTMPEKKVNSADNFNKVILQKIIDEKLDIKHFHVTGHSLGAALADIQATFLDELLQNKEYGANEKWEVSTTVFDNPGSRPMIEDFHKKSPNYKSKVKYTTINNGVNFINSLNEKPGDVWEIYRTTDPNSGIISNAKDQGASHSLSEFLKAWVNKAVVISNKAFYDGPEFEVTQFDTISGEKYTLAEEKVFELNMVKNQQGPSISDDQLFDDSIDEESKTVYEYVENPHNEISGKNNEIFIEDYFK
jgi:hypothetical protein